MYATTNLILHTGGSERKINWEKTKYCCDIPSILYVAISLGTLAIVVHIGLFHF